MSYIANFAASTAPRFRLLHLRHWKNRRALRLDPKALPDHLKRDLGFMGGRSSPCRDPLRD